MSKGMNFWRRRAIVALMLLFFGGLACAALVYWSLWVRYDNALQQLEPRSERLEGVVDAGACPMAPTARWVWVQFPAWWPRLCLPSWLRWRRWWRRDASTSTWAGAARAGLRHPATPRPAIQAKGSALRCARRWRRSAPEPPAPVRHAPATAGENRRFAAQSSHEERPMRWSATARRSVASPRTTAQSLPLF